MAGLLDYLSSNYAGSQLQRDPNAAAALAQVDPSSGQTLGGLISSFFSPSPGAVNGALLRNPNAVVANPVAVPAASASVGAPMGFGGGGALQAAPQLPAPTAQAAPAATAGMQSSSQPTNLPAMQIAQATGAPDVTVDDQGNASDAWQPNPNGGGIIGALGAAAQDASGSPEKSKTLLGTLGSSISSIGDRLSNLSPDASQALLASGLTMLANNDGTRNLSQLVGIGGISGLNAYDASRQNRAANALALAKQQQEQQHQSFSDALDLRKQLWEEGKPVTVGQDQSLFTPYGRPIVQSQPSVARTTEVQGQDGNTYTVQLDRAGNMIGQPLLKSNPNIGPLNDQ